ncbi:hypothetical protein XNC2_2357 [Xenorhabdus nematophila AN6/1]|nr:hypothetical protein XNW1_3960003 [Xenorhabdus nematophila str. Websteri]CEF34168.1 hypothetical protein XNW1_850003 [Xenorhabdus nematophila str. Websteri]CEK23351.1 hypothetical protein XNC2_2357 [Xenorhabdus nematophila AN6/1]
MSYVVISPVYLTAYPLGYFICHVDLGCAQIACSNECQLEPGLSFSYCYHHLLKNWENYQLNLCSTGNRLTSWIVRIKNNTNFPDKRMNLENIL